VTYIAPLAFVLLVTMGKEAYDDYKRNLRDREANSARYLSPASGTSSSDDEELSNSSSRRQPPSHTLCPFFLHPCRRPRPSREEPACTGRPRPPAHVRLIRNMLHPYRPAGWRNRLEAARRRPSDAKAALRTRNSSTSTLRSTVRATFPQRDYLPLPVCLSPYGPQRMRHPRTFTYVYRHVYDQHTTQHILERSTNGASTNSRTALS
jgi:hypothetical protein